MKADRIAKLAEKAMIAGVYKGFLTEYEAVKLLRREQAYQRATVRRIISKYFMEAKAWKPKTKSGKVMRLGTMQTCHDILAAMNRRTV